MPRQQQVPKPMGSLAVNQTQARAEAAGEAHIHAPLLELQNPRLWRGLWPPRHRPHLPACLAAPHEQK